MAIEKVPVLGRPLGQLAFAEAKRNWPFLLGFAVTLTGVVQLSLALPKDAAQKSPFVNPNAHR